MLLRIRHALLEVANPPNRKQSAIIINNEVIISSAFILQPYVQSSSGTDLDESTNDCFEIIEKLQKCELVNAQDENSAAAKYLNTLSYQVTFDQRKLPHCTQLTASNSNRRQPHILTRYRAKLLYIFCASDVSRKLHSLFSTANTCEYNEVLRSSFVVLSVRPSQKKETFGRFLQHIGNYLRYVERVHTLDDVVVMCSPFGLENFYKTISIGKVSNVMGRNGCLFSLSNALPLGCEGAAVFNNKLRLIGVIICTSFQRQHENVNLTLAASFSYLLRDFMQQLGIPITTFHLVREPTNFAWERTMVVILSDGKQGTGTFVKVHNKHFILTCAHVVGQVNDKVNCRGVDGEFVTDVLWCNPVDDCPFDVALLTAPAHIPARYFVRLANNRPVLGQTVYNAGFPYFVNFNLKYDFNPSVFQGRIIKCDNGAIMSDGCVQAGQSGGPMFDQNGSILGICVSNIKIDDVIYPNINTAVPIYDIRPTLESYAKTNDVGVLSNLVANQDVQRVWSLATPIIQSKL